MHAIEKFPEFACLDCGNGILGPIARPFEAFNWKVCDMCGLNKMTLPANVFANYEELLEQARPAKTATNDGHS